MIIQGDEVCLGKNRSFFLFGLFALATLIIFDIGSISLSFVFGATLIIFSLKDYRTFFMPKGKVWFLIAFVFIVYISLLFAELPATKSTIIGIIRLLYWLLLAIFVYNAYIYIDKEALSMVVFLSVVIVILLDVFALTLSQNAIAFTVIIMGPLGYFCLKRYYVKLLYSGGLIYLMLLNGSRTGAILSLIQFILVLSLFTPGLGKRIKIILVSALILSMGLFFSPVRYFLGEKVSLINNEAGNLIINPKEVFRNDLSWLQRRAQINKGFQIVKEHPLFGIGLFNFPKYYVNIETSNIDTDRKVIKGIDKRSAHNAYVDLIAETGLLGFFVILLMLLSAFIKFIGNISKLPGEFEGSVFISYVGLLIYLYVISGFYGTSTWIMLGLILGASEYLANRFDSYLEKSETTI